MSWPCYDQSVNLADTASFLRRMTVFYGWIMRWMGRRGDRVMITNGKYVGHKGMVESNVYQRTVDYPGEWHNGLPRPAGYWGVGDGALGAGGAVRSDKGRLIPRMTSS